MIKITQQRSSALLNLLLTLTSLSISLGVSLAHADKTPTTQQDKIQNRQTKQNTEDERSLSLALSLISEGKKEEASGLLELLLAKPTTSPELKTRAQALYQLLSAQDQPQAQPSALSETPETPETHKVSSKQKSKKVNKRPWAALTTSSGLFGLTLYGPTMATQAGNSGRAAVGLYLLTVGASIAAPLTFYRPQDVTWSMSDLAHTGFSRGLMHGALFASLVDAKSDAQLGLSSLFSLSEGFAGLAYAQKSKLSTGHTHTLTVTHDISMISMLSALAIFEPKTEEGLTAPLLLSGLAGYGLGDLFYKKSGRQDTWGNMEAVRMSSFVGLLASAALVSNLELDNKVGGVTFLAGALGGAGAGLALTKTRTLSTVDALITDLTAVGGGFAGAGLTYMLGFEEEPILWGAVAGSVAGYWFGLSLSDQKSESASEVSPQSSLGPLMIPGAQRGDLVRGLMWSGQL
jgi:hypothetical protein